MCIRDSEGGHGHGQMNGGRQSFAHSEADDALITQDIGGGGDGEHEEFEFSEVRRQQISWTIVFIR